MTACCRCCPNVTLLSHTNSSRTASCVRRRRDSCSRAGWQGGAGTNVVEGKQAGEQLGLPVCTQTVCDKV